MNNPHPSELQQHMTALRVAALEPIVIELVLLAISEAAQQRATRKLKRLLDELEFAGISEEYTIEQATAVG